MCLVDVRTSSLKLSCGHSEMNGHVSLFGGPHGDISEKDNFEILAFFSSHCNFIKIWLKLRLVLHTDRFHSSESVSCSWRGTSVIFSKTWYEAVCG